jgi:DNA-binding beta-propeller fold protein YncE
MKDFSFRRIGTLALLLLCPAFTAIAQNHPPLKRVQEFQFPASVKGRLDHLGIDLDGKRLFVVGEEAHTVLVFDLTTGKVIQQIAVDHPHAVLYRNDLSRIYITDEGKGALNIYDGKTYKLVKSVALKVDTDSIGYDPSTHDLYIVNGGDNAHETFTMLSVVDTTAAQKLADIKIDGDTLEAMAVERTGNLLYLDNPAKNTVDVIDRKTNKMIAAWPVKLGKGNSTMALDDPAHRLFVGCRDGKLVVFDTQSAKEMQSLAIGPRSDDLAFDAKSKRIYVISGGEGAIDVYHEKDPDHYEALGKVPSAPGAKTGLWVPELNRLFVSAPAQGTASGKVYVYEAQ